MKKLLSLFLVLVTLLGILPTAAFAADSEEEALGEVNIYNGEYELGYLSINGSVRKQIYTYFLYEANDGTQKESPAYCVNPNQYGVPQTVGPGESIKYLAEERASDPKVVGIISNGYPHRSLGELKLDNKYQAYYATKMALWCYLMPDWNIANLKVAPGRQGHLQAGHYLQLYAHPPHDRHGGQIHGLPRDHRGRGIQAAGVHRLERDVGI